MFNQLLRCHRSACGVTDPLIYHFPMQSERNCTRPIALVFEKWNLFLNWWIDYNALYIENGGDSIIIINMEQTSGVFDSALLAFCICKRWRMYAPRYNLHRLHKPVVSGPLNSYAHWGTLRWCPNMPLQKNTQTEMCSISITHNHNNYIFWKEKKNKKKTFVIMIPKQ